MTEHIIHGYWCPCCRKIVEPAVLEAMPGDNIGLHTFVLTAWQHYSGGISLNYVIDQLGKRLERHREELFTFLEYENVSPYNNHAEQQMRKPVLWRRHCQQNRSDRGMKAPTILMSVFRTAELQGLKPVDYVEALVKEQILLNHVKTKAAEKAT